MLRELPSVGKSDGSTIWSGSMTSLPITGGFTSLTRTRCMMCLIIMIYQNDSTWSIELGAQGPGLQTTSEINVRTVVGISISAWSDSLRLERGLDLDTFVQVAGGVDDLRLGGLGTWKESGRTEARGSQAKR